MSQIERVLQASKNPLKKEKGTEQTLKLWDKISLISLRFWSNGSGQQAARSAFSVFVPLIGWQKLRTVVSFTEFVNFRKEKHIAFRYFETSTFRNLFRSRLEPSIRRAKRGYYQESQGSRFNF